MCETKRWRYSLWNKSMFLLSTITSVYRIHWKPFFAVVLLYSFACFFHQKFAQNIYHYLFINNYITFIYPCTVSLLMSGSKVALSNPMLPTGNYWFQKFDWCSTRVESIKLQETNQFFWVHFRRLQLRLSMLQKQPPKVIYKKSVLKNFAMLTGKHLCWSLFFIKVSDFQHRWESPTQLISCECPKIIKNTYFEEHLQTAASDALLFRNQYQKLTQICSSKLLKTNVL